MFYDLFVELCQKNKVAPTRAALDMGLSKSAPIKWRTTKATPQGETLNKIAVYFGVSVDSLLGKEDNKKTPRPEGQDVTFDDFTYAMYEEARELSNENKQKLLEMAQFFKQQQAKEKG